MKNQSLGWTWRTIFVLVASCFALCTQSFADNGPVPLLAAGRPVMWWTVFKFNAASFPGCGAESKRRCTFGGEVQSYAAFGEQYAYASSDDPTLKQGVGCNGESTADPLGATFDEIYNSTFYYVVWNDQFYDDPPIAGCKKECSSPWGHSKGMVAWNAAGDGVVLQVSTPSWPASGSRSHPRQSDGNTLGCIKDNNVLVSQHFFALRLSKDDLTAVLQALANASVVTDPDDLQIVNNGGPADVQSLVRALGKKSTSNKASNTVLSSGVRLLSKPSGLHVPPWQFVSAELGGAPLRAATWWANPKIPTTAQSTSIDCWDAQLDKAGSVEIAVSGRWGDKSIGLKGTASGSGNHAKIGTSKDQIVAIFGDLNQQGVLSGDPIQCKRSQNGRGGLFYVVPDPTLAASINLLITGDTAPELN